LYGIPEKKKLAQIPDIYWDNPPVWSPDGSKFIMMGNDEFYLVTYDGAISKITHLNPDYDLYKGAGFRYLADYYSWSPDSQHVAFWLSPFGTERYTLAILDTHSGEIIEYCIPIGDGFPQYGLSTLYPVWSPDGKKLVVAANFRPNLEPGNDVILVDLEKEKSYKVTENTFPVGWLVAP
jgi:Tol biopolymer transport system component